MSANKLAAALERALKIIGPDWEDAQGRPLKPWHERASKLVAAHRAQQTTKQTKEPTNDR